MYSEILKLLIGKNGSVEHGEAFYIRVEPVIDPLLSREQPGFRQGSSTVAQGTLTQEIEDSFSAKKKAGAVFVDLTAAYDTVSIAPHLQTPTCWHMVSFVMELVRNRSFTLTTANGLRSRLPV